MITIIMGVIVMSILYFTIRPCTKLKLPLTMATTSIVGLVLLLGLLGWDAFIDGVLGAGGIQPWKVLVIFFSVAYVSISVDVTGIFDYLAYQLVRLANGNGRLLFLFFYCFAGFLSIFTSNDIVILTLTPIIFYLGKHAKINIVPLLFAEFFAANTLSMLLYIDNPTNIIMVNALGIGFLEYFSMMWLPTTVAAVTNYFLLWLVFRKTMTKKYTLNTSSDFSVRHWVDVVIGSIMLICMFVILVFSDTFELEVWMVTLFFAVLFIMEDLIFGVYYYMKSSRLSKVQLEKRRVILDIPDNKNEFWLAIKRVPWNILPFVSVFFILIHHFNEVGMVTTISEWLLTRSTSLWGSIGLNGFVAFVTANIINNQPMAILFSYVYTGGQYVVTSAQVQGAVYATIIASNLAANFTIVGALAGLMWKRILKVKGVEISYIDFLKKGVLVTPLVFFVALLTLYIVLL